MPLTARQVAQPLEKRRRLRPAAVRPVTDEEIRLRVQRVLFWRHPSRI